MEVGACLRAGERESRKLPLDFSLQLMELMDEVRVQAGIDYQDIE
jgi:hypothetical protein